jgi:RNA polymerase sigma-70 factor (ECF subfamily)
VTAPHPDSLETRASLLARLKDWDDHASWWEFHDTYRRLIHNFAIKLGVAEDGAKDIVQETLLSVAKAIREFQYDPQKCSFKSWLLSVARNRVTDHFRRHPREREARRAPEAATARTSTIERVPDPRSLAIEDVWEAEWRNNVMELALEKLKAHASTKHFQIFYLHVIKQQSTSKVTKALGVSVGQVYLVKHRLKGAFEKAVKRLEQELDASPDRPGSG